MTHGLMQELEALGFRLLAGGHEPRSGAWQPPVDVFVTGEKVVIIIEAAGVDASNIDVTYDSGTLIVRGYRPRPVHGYEPKSFVHMEIPHGFFERRIALAMECDSDAVNATYVDGMIVVEAPLGKAARRKEIPIE
jgi:HSP20 family protein